MDDSRPKGFSVKLFMPSGQPEGLRIIEKSNWSGQGVAFPRASHAEVQRRSELRRTGVYILWEPGSIEEMPRAYVGETDDLLTRLKQQEEREFWTQAVIFSSKDQNLNKAHVQYLEARLLQIAKEAKRCKLENSTLPQGPSLSESDKADADLFLSDVLLCLPLVGISFLSDPSNYQDLGPLLFLNAKGLQATGYEIPSGFVGKAGSQAPKEETPTIRKHLSTLRANLLAEGTFLDRDSHFELVEDFVFSSSSQAAGVMLGRSASGPEEWKNGEGLTLKKIQEAKLNSL